MSALVWSSALSCDSTIQTAAKIGARWDEGLSSLGQDDLKRNKSARGPDEDLPSDREFGMAPPANSYVQTTVIID